MWKNSMRKTILAADDSPVARDALGKIFEAEKGYELRAIAVNGEEAIDIAKEYKPDLIILDLVMPVVNGIEAARVLKRIMPHVPIILFTVYSETAANHLLGT